MGMMNNKYWNNGILLLAINANNKLAPYQMDQRSCTVMGDIRE